MISENKLKSVKSNIINKHGCGGNVCQECAVKFALIDKYAECNIPVGYWFLNMSKFFGSSKVKEVINAYIENLEQNYLDGTSICLAGNQGTGKTMSSICILKAGIKSGKTAHYTTASDILNTMTTREGVVLSSTLRKVDFLVIDELDSRFFPSDSAKELFSGIYENIFRFRVHNTLPTILCTNETDELLNVFYGPGVYAIKSLNAQYLKIYPVVGKDFRSSQGGI